MYCHCCHTPGCFNLRKMFKYSIDYLREINYLCTNKVRERRNSYIEVSTCFLKPEEDQDHARCSINLILMIVILTAGSVNIL